MVAADDTVIMGSIRLPRQLIVNARNHHDLERVSVAQLCRLGLALIPKAHPDLIDRAWRETGVSPAARETR